MKKLLICIITLILVFSLSSCISINKKLRIIGNTEDIIAIDVYYIDVTNEKIVTETIDEYEPVYSVPADELVAFANKMETIIYKKNNFGALRFTQCYGKSALLKFPEG